MRDKLFAPEELTQDALLGGLVQLMQPREGYRAGTDPVLLAASVPAQAGQSVLELGCGAGPGLCCLGRRVQGLHLSGIELQPAYAQLGQHNLANNDLTGTVWQGDLDDMPAELKAQRFDHVIANPPYFVSEKRIQTDLQDREVARAGQTPLARWVQVASKRAKPKGFVTFIQRTERLPDLLGAMQHYLGSVELWPLIPRQGRAPRLILVRGRKGGRGAFRFHPSQILHAAAQHRDGSGDYVPEIQAVMERGAALPFPE